MYHWASCDQHRQRNPNATRAFARLLGKIMNKENLIDQINDIDEHISHLQWRCENTVNHSELKKLRKTIKSLKKSKQKLSKKLLDEGDIHNEIT